MKLKSESDDSNNQSDFFKDNNVPKTIDSDKNYINPKKVTFGVLEFLCIRLLLECFLMKVMKFLKLKIKSTIFTVFSRFDSENVVNGLYNPASNLFAFSMVEI